MRRWKYERDGEWIELDAERSRMVDALLAMLDAREMACVKLEERNADLERRLEALTDY